jgi:hypothetical protein
MWRMSLEHGFASNTVLPKPIPPCFPMTHTCYCCLHALSPHTCILLPCPCPSCSVVVDPSQLCDVLAIASGSEANQMQDVGDVYSTLLDSCGASQV